MIAAAVLCLSRAALMQAERGAWLASGIALASYAAGEICWSVAIGDDPAPPIPSLADLLYLGFYPPAYIGVVLLARARLPEFRSSLWLDGVIGALAVAAVAVAVLFDRVLSATEGSPEVVAVTMAYPLGDLLLLSMIAALAAVTGWQLGGNAAVVAGSLVVAAIADATYLAQSAAGTYQEGYPIDSAWLTANLLLGCRGLAAVARASPAPPRPPAGGGGAGPVRADGHRRAAVRDLRRVPSLGCHPVQRGPAGRHRPCCPVVPREPEAAGHQPRAGTLRPAHRPAQPPGDEEDLPHTIEHAREREPQVLVLMDLNGFKAYNDSYGHLAGDALLTRVATNPPRRWGGSGHAYRLGGDEFCAVVELRGRTAGNIAADTAAALLEHGDGFTIGACFGTALLPGEARDAHSALRMADQRLYAHKADRSRRPDPSTGGALAALIERSPDLAGQSQVAQLAQRVAARLGACTDSLNGAAELRESASSRCRTRSCASPLRWNRPSASSCARSCRGPADPERHPGAGADREDRPRRARELGRQRLPGRPEGARRSPGRPASSPCATRSRR